MAEHVPYSNITLESIDTAVLSWVDKILDAHVEDQNGSRKKVPVIFATGERWLASRGKKGLRDENGVLILPMISIRRTGIDMNQSLNAGILGTEEGNFTIARRLSDKTRKHRNAQAIRNASNLSPIDNAPIYEITTIPFPSTGVISYELTIQTQFVTHMNEIIEKLYHQMDYGSSFVAHIDDNTGKNLIPQSGVPFKDRSSKTDPPYIVGFFDSGMSSGDNFEEFTDQERIVKFTTTFTVPATLQLNPEGTKPSVQKELTSFGLRFGEDQARFVDDPYELELIFEQKQLG